MTFFVARPARRLGIALLSLALSLAAQPRPPGIAEAPLRPLPASHGLPPYAPVPAGSIPAADRLVRSARWIRAQVWTAGTIGDASAYLFPRGYDVTSGYGCLGTDYFSWLLEHDAPYFQYDLAHNDHQLDVPLGSGNDAVIERVMMTGGSNSYDMACWSLALSVAWASCARP